MDIKFFFRVTLDAFTGVSRPQEVSGLCTFDKKVVLFGSEGSASVFSSQFRPSSQDVQLRSRTNAPQATVECVDPICLGCKVIDICDCNCCCDCDVSALPEFVCGSFEGDIVSNGQRACFVTIGLFSIVRLERKVQLLIPCYDFCVPEKECIGSTDDNPCKLFRSMKFPTEEFFPPQIFEFPGLNAIGDVPRDKNCGCK